MIKSVVPHWTQMSRHRHHYAYMHTCIHTYIHTYIRAKVSGGSPVHFDAFLVCQGMASYTESNMVRLNYHSFTAHFQ